MGEIRKVETIEVIRITHLIRDGKTNPIREETQYYHLDGTPIACIDKFMDDKKDISELSPVGEKEKRIP